MDGFGFGFGRHSKIPKTGCNEAMLLSFSSPPPPQQQVGVGLIRGVFTASQWMELQHQALIYKYITANVPIPSYLLNPIAKALTSNPLGWTGFQLGLSNGDPEPGRCRRTDGKKWRCSRDAVGDQKYCERHINRGRHRSRKPVEPQPPLSTTNTQHLPDLPSPVPPINRSLVDMTTSSTTGVQESSFGLVCSDSLLNPLSSRSSLVDSDNLNEHSLRQLMDDWPNTQLSISIPTGTSSPIKDELSMGLGTSSISWTPSMGGPLGEALQGECTSSPTGVLQRGPFGSVTNSSTASSPRAEPINPSLRAL